MKKTRPGDELDMDLSLVKSISKQEFLYWYPEGKNLLRKKQFSRAFLYLSSHFSQARQSMNLFETSRVCKRLVEAGNKILLVKYLGEEDLMEKRDKIYYLIKRLTAFHEIWHKTLLAILYKNVEIEIEPEIEEMITRVFLGGHAANSRDSSPKRHMLAQKLNSTKSFKNLSMKLVFAGGSPKQGAEIDLEEHAQLEKAEEARQQKARKEHTKFMQTLKENMSEQTYKCPAKVYSKEIKSFILLSIQTLMYKAIFVKKIKNFSLAAKMFMNLMQFSFELEGAQLDCDIVTLQAEVHTQMGNFFSEVLDFNSSIPCYETALEYLQLELNFRGKEKENLENKKVEHLRHKYEKCLKQIAVVTFNLAINYENIDNIEKHIEALNLANWIAQNNLKDYPQVINAFEKKLRKSRQKYDKMLTGIGEMKKVINMGLEFSKKKKKEPSQPEDTNQGDFFAELMYLAHDVNNLHKSQYHFQTSYPGTHFNEEEPVMSKSRRRSSVDRTSAHEKPLEDAGFNNTQMSTEVSNEADTTVSKIDALSEFMKDMTLPPHLKTKEIYLTDNFPVARTRSRQVTISTPNKQLTDSINQDSNDTGTANKTASKAGSEFGSKSNFISVPRNFIIKGDSASKAVINTSASMKKVKVPKIKPKVLTLESYFKTYEEAQDEKKKRQENQMNEMQMMQLNEGPLVKEAEESEDIIEMDDYFAEKINKIISEEEMKKNVDILHDNLLELKQNEGIDKKEFGLAKRMVKFRKEFGNGGPTVRYDTDDKVNPSKEYTLMEKEANRIGAMINYEKLIKEKTEKEKEKEKNNFEKNVMKADYLKLWKEMEVIHTQQEENEDSIPGTPSNKKEMSKSLSLPAIQGKMLQSLDLRKMESKAAEIDLNKLAEKAKTSIKNGINHIEKSMEKLDNEKKWILKREEGLSKKNVQQKRFLSSSISDLSLTSREFLNHKRKIGRKLVATISHVTAMRGITGLIRKMSYKHEVPEHENNAAANNTSE